MPINFNTKGLNMRYHDKLLLTILLAVSTLFQATQEHRNLSNEQNEEKNMVVIREIKIGKFYKHYKGNFYKVIAIARYSEDPKQLFVVYQALYNAPEFGMNSVWVRPYEMFAENVVIDGIEQERFQEID